MSNFITDMEGVREYGEGYVVELHEEENGRLAIFALNEGGYNVTSVDLIDLIQWVKRNKPELLNV